jgi:hypothetical protein
MHYIVNFSAGLTSWKALQRTIERYGKESTTAVFADTKIEDEDSYRFLRDTEQYFGIEIQTVADGRTPFEIWRAAKTIIIVSGVAPCSKILKRETIDRWVTEHFAGQEITRVFGMDWTEPHRMIRLRASLAPTPVWFPLAEPPYVDKCHISNELDTLGIAVPALYLEGFDHNNCGGGCVKAGQAHWAHLWRTRPETYARWQKEEADFIEWYGKKITILKDRRGSIAKQPMTLTEFRARLERGEAYDTDDWGGCGCFAPVQQMRMDDFILEADIK